eukprot:CAMPEP_0179126984 /NCGR_PEP_ID=MMETSP0796-20121207/60135_1 /TAXON_ID=73915 /ORGANISM="Pyrodinium bahamense, Strain pbaha01" /LENGTH=77 /DNA_ID=CAMNT_0020825759 /DNA_START=117 /DNA_END=350 /DNA_ORIENTATION=-
MVVNSGSVANGEQAVTPAVIEAHQKELDACLREVEESAKKAKEAAAMALETAEKCRQIEEETKKMIAQFNQDQGSSS